MTVPAPLPPVGLPVIYRDRNGDDAIGWIVVPEVDVNGIKMSCLSTASLAIGLNLSYYHYDDSADPAPDTWRYDPRYPVDAFPSDLDGRLDALELAQPSGAQGYGAVAFHDTATPLELALTGGTYETLTGGTLQGASAGLTYDPVTGELTVSTAGVYLVSLSVTERRILGLTSTDATAAVFVDGVESVLVARSSLAAVADTRNLAAQAPLQIGAGAVLTLRTRTEAGTSIEVTDYLLSATWIAS